MPTVKSIVEDIQFGFDHIDEIVPAGRRQGAGIAPVLRYAAALNVDADVKDFVAAAEELGLHPATAKTCFYKGRKQILAGDETPPPKAKKKAEPKIAPRGVDPLTIPDPEDIPKMNGRHTDPSYVRGWNQVKRRSQKRKS